MFSSCKKASIPAALLFLIVPFLWTPGSHTYRTDSAQDCILVIGDSIAYGTVVFEVPSHGYVVVRTKPFSLYLDEYLRINEAIHFGIYDLSVEARSLTGPDPYTMTSVYQVALDKYCRFIVVFPWINDLSNPTLASQPDRYVETLAQFIESLLAQKPQTGVVVMGYYFMQPAPFSLRTYGEGITDNRLTRLNAALSFACTDGGKLARLGDVVYFDTNALLQALGYPYTLSSFSPADFYPLLYEPLTTEAASLFQVFWRDNPAGQVNADGVHLSDTAKQILAGAVYQQLLAIDPRALQPLTRTGPSSALP